jgi:hypothetical protein
MSPSCGFKRMGSSLSLEQWTGGRFAVHDSGRPAVLPARFRVITAVPSNTRYPFACSSSRVSQLSRNSPAVMNRGPARNTT